ncbi:MAG TPA: DUF3482 domain-containing protein [Casimicrobiaceae bacterium]|nr:DUF3482 domain-containing protein [Casimicrobiaceae bacterium]
MNATTIALSLISHTNAGKTTLARTLLGRDIGEVGAAPHVTLEAAAYTLQTTAQGDALVLWDTPGFGNSARLAQRLAAHSDAIGWLLAQTWDRFREPGFYLSQRAVRNVRDEADVVLYLVNAAESPSDTGYLTPELDVLGWIARPTFVLLNQTGRPRGHAAAAEDEARWLAAVGQRPFIRGVLSLDAFTRCWVQESVLLAALAPAVPGHKQAAYGRLVAAWQARRVAQFDAAMEAIAAPVALAACDRVVLTDDSDAGGRWLGAVRSLAVRPLRNRNARDAATALAARLDAAVRDSTNRLIALHDLEGSAGAAVRAQLGEHVRVDAPLHEGKAALMGSLVSGALAGLAADLAAGGLSLGAGTLVGAIAGALGGRGVARGYNVLRGHTRPVLQWDEELLDDLVAAAILRYLAVAHFGRGRGAWTEDEDPAFWRDTVQRELRTRRSALEALWQRRGRDCEALRMEADLRAFLAACTHAVLLALYPVLREPGAKSWFEVPRASPPKRA